MITRWVVETIGGEVYYHVIVRRSRGSRFTVRRFTGYRWPS